MIRAAVGLSIRPDASEAAREAASRACDRRGAPRADWCVVFATPDHAAAASELLEGVGASAGTPYVAGCSGAGVVAEGREVEDGPAVGVLAASADEIRATPFLFRDGGDLGLSAGREAGERLVGSRGLDDLILAWPDPRQVRPDRFLRGIEEILPGVPVAGGAAAGRAASGPPLLFHGTETAEAAVSGVRLGGRFRHRAAVTQGCRPLTGPLVVTRSHGNLVLELEGRPPLSLLAEASPEGLLDSGGGAFDRLFVGLLPDATATGIAAGGYLVRSILTADEDTGVIGIAAEVEEGDSILFAVREGGAARKDLARVLADASAKAEGPWRFGLYFDCLARGRSLYGETGVDSALLESAFPGLPILGFFCAAEIAPLGGVNRVLTYTGALILIGD